MVHLDRALLIRTSESGSPSAMRRRGRRGVCRALAGNCSAQLGSLVAGFRVAGTRTHRRITIVGRVCGGRKGDCWARRLEVVKAEVYMSHG